MPWAKAVIKTDQSSGEKDKVESPIRGLTAEEEKPKREPVEREKLNPN